MLIWPTDEQDTWKMALHIKIVPDPLYKFTSILKYDNKFLQNIGSKDK